MKYAISNIAWKPSQKEKIYQLIIDKEFDGLEISPNLFLDNYVEPYEVDINILREIYEKIKNKGLNLISMQSLLYGTTGLYLFKNNNTRKTLNKYMKKAIDFAAILKINNLVFGSPKNRIIPKDMDKSTANKIAVKFFKELGDYAHLKGTCIGMEPNAKTYGGNWIIKTMEAVELVKKVNSKGFRLNLDMGTMSLNDEKEDIIIEAFPYVNYVHISEGFLKPVPQSVDLHLKRAKIFNTLDYRGYISIEMNTINSINNYNQIKLALEFVRNIYK